MGKRPERIKHTTSAPTIRDETKRFYQSIDWKRKREQMRKAKRKEHEKIVIDVYKDNPENDPDDFHEFINGMMPLCEHNLKKGRIKVAQVLDHIKPIRSGGAKLSSDNLQWLTSEVHNSKSGKEAHD